MRDIRNFAFLSHVDAGKTTLTERVLFASGASRRLGSVDEGTARTDDMTLERKRGISVRARGAALDWKGCRLNLIDTPGHSDFAAEAERALMALDGAVLLISAPDGVQPHTVTLCAALREARLPFLIFINKCDREGADPATALAEAEKELSIRAPFLSPAFLAGEDPDEALCEAVCDGDDIAMARYLDSGKLSNEEAWAALARACKAGRLAPALFGSAATGDHADALLDCVVRLLPPPDEGGEELCAVVFGVDESGASGRRAHARVFSGSLKTRQAPARKGRETLKITQIKPLAVNLPPEELGELSAGEVGALYGLRDCRVGDVLGDEALLPRPMPLGRMQPPLIMAGVRPEKEEQKPELMKALEIMTAENPLLDARWEGEQALVSLAGALQLEVLPQILSEDFKLTATLTEPEILYKETPLQEGVGFYAYTMPKPCWAVLKFMVEPLPLGSGVIYEDLTGPEELRPRYRKQVRQTIPRALRQGNYGYEVTDVRVSLIMGEDHPIHTHPLDFALCTPVALMDALRGAGTRLLEPMLRLSLVLPREALGRLLTDVPRMRGEIVESRVSELSASVEARLPLSGFMDYPAAFRAYTGGRGRMASRFDGYAPCPEGFAHSVPYRGVHPLDTAKYILAARSALENEIWD